MTKDVLHKLVSEALNISAVEQELIEIIADELDPRGIARAIWDQYEDEIIEAAAEVAAEEILPF
jgi:hypothetical protein